MIVTGPQAFMMIEPAGKATAAIQDELTRKAVAVMAAARASDSMTKGVHVCVCGVCSDNKQWFIEGALTNNLLVHYIESHRSDVPAEELEKLEILYQKVITPGFRPMNPNLAAMRRMGKPASRADQARFDAWAKEQPEHVD